MRSGSAVASLVLFLLGLPIVVPLFGVDWFESHEGASYPARVVQVGRCWDDGMWSARWFPDLAGGRGYPFLSFYAPLTFWSAAALAGVGVPVATSLKIVVLGATFLGLAGAYRLARLGTGRAGAIVAAALYAYAPYHLRDLWTRGDLAEYLALGLLPWSLWATLRLARRATARDAALAAVAGAAAILSHNVLGLFTGLAMALAAVVVLAGSASRPRRDRLIATVLAGGGALVSTAFFWLPALAEKKWVQLDNLRTGYFDPARNFLEPGELFGLRRPPREFVLGEAEPMTFELGVVLLLLPLAILAFREPRGRRVALVAGALLILGVALCLPIAAFAYETLPLLRFVGLPWRFLSWVSLGAALVAGLGLGRALAGRSRIVRAGGATIVAAGAILSVPDLLRPLAPLDLQPWMLDPAAYREANFTASAANEYTPIWARRKESIPFRGGIAATGSARIRNVERGVARWSFDVESDEPQTIVLRDFFYPGWRGSLDSEPVEIVPRPGSGHAQLEVPAGPFRFEGRLHPTPVRRAARWISLAAVLALAALAWRPVRP